MSVEKFSDTCAGCRPAMIDLTTGKPLPDEHPALQAILRVWDETTIHERKAWHAFTCCNARDPLTMALVPGLTHKMQLACRRAR